MAKPVSILVTGFGPFDEAGPGNLSYSVVTTLPKFLPATRSSQVPVRIVAHPYDIPVIYSEVHTLVPRLYDAYSREVDIWLHLGMRPGQNSYSIELLLDAPEVSPQLGSVRIRKSTDPGHFICDFLYYSVLAEHWRRKNGVDGGPRPPDLMPVAFLNVPTDNTVEELRRARHVTMCLLRALAESWASKRDGTGNHNGQSAS
ncbi:hypothetical protein E4T50_08193 [Aureobasidium sp. EXF-12298]|nr:hypothetical protein E4T50_08193 [Aureobasidium sp. EXF-12298]